MTIRVIRSSGYYGRVRALKLRLDGQEVARVRNGETVNFAGNGSAQTLRAHMDWMASPPVQIADPGQGVVVIEVAMPSALAGSWRTFWRPRTAIQVRVVAPGARPQVSAGSAVL